MMTTLLSLGLIWLGSNILLDKIGDFAIYVVQWYKRNKLNTKKN